MDDLVIMTRGLSKEYNGFKAVFDLNLEVQKGEVFGLLGPNGAGKTTTILMLLGLTEPTDGEVEVLGFDPVRQPLSVKSVVGYLPEQVGFYDEMTAYENLAYIARLNGYKGDESAERIQEALEKVGMLESAQKPMSTFSRGMRQRIGLADLLVKKPQLVIMDEPTQGLDPESAQDFLTLIIELKQAGITVLLSSHLLHQVQAVCDRVGLFRKGKLVLTGTVEELANKVLGGAYKILAETSGLDQDFCVRTEEIPGVTNVRLDENGFVEVVADKDLRSRVAEEVIDSGGKLLALDIETRSLDNIYASYFKEARNESDD
jgi:ABC-2 type transport system ATP-binding protein